MINNLKNLKKIYIHSGAFNTDDVMSVALLKIINPSIKIERVKTIPITTNEEMLIGIGKGKYNYKRFPYARDEYGNLPSNTGLLWSDIGMFVLEKYGFEKLEEAYEMFYFNYINKINIGTRYSYSRVKRFFENDIIHGMNVSMISLDNGKEKEDIHFINAVNTSIVFIENWIRVTLQEIEYREQESKIWQDAVKQSENGIYILQERIPWRRHVDKENENQMKLIINKSNRGGYSVYSKDVDLIKVEGKQYLSYIHPSKFMGIADSLENAVLAAKQSIEIYKNE